MQIPDMTLRRARILRIIPLLLLAVMVAACSPPKPPETAQATLLPSPKPIADFQLADHAGQPFTLDNLKNRWTFAFFGYTHCPDVCPTSLSMLGQVQRLLEKSLDANHRPQVIFVSVDPERDTPELLSKFVPYFHPDFVGVTGDAGEILRLTRQLGIIYARSDGEANTADSYLVDHSAAIILFDPAGKFHALFNVPHDPKLIATDFLAIQAYYEAIR